MSETQPTNARQREDRTESALRRVMRNTYGHSIVAAALMHLGIEPSWRVLIVSDPQPQSLSPKWRERLESHESQVLHSTKRLLRTTQLDPDCCTVSLSVPQAKNLASLTVQEFAALDEWHQKGRLPEPYRNPTLVLLLTLHGYSLDGKEAVVATKCLWRPEEGVESFLYLKRHRGQWEVIYATAAVCEPTGVNHVSL